MLTEKELSQMAHDPEIMYYRWQGRINKGLKTLEREQNPEERKNMEFMLQKQLAKLAKLRRAMLEKKRNKLNKRNNDSK